MITDESKLEISKPPQNTEAAAEPGVDSKFKTLLIILALLVLAEAYSLARISSMRKALAVQEAQTRKELTTEFNEQLSAKLLPIERENAEQLDMIRSQLDEASKHMGAQRMQLRAAQAKVAKLQNQNDQQLSDLRHEIALKADQEQLGALTQDVSATKTNLDSTKKNVDSIAENLGMTRTQFGTLIARNHDQIEALRKLGERDYYEFTIQRNQPAHVAGVGFELKKTNVKHHRFNVMLLVDDAQVAKNNRTINEPIFIAVQGSRSFYEMVVNKVDKHSISGYISTPKGASQVAARSEGGR